MSKDARQIPHNTFWALLTPEGEYKGGIRTQGAPPDLAENPDEYDAVWVERFPQSHERFYDRTARTWVADQELKAKLERPESPPPSMEEVQTWLLQTLPLLGITITPEQRGELFPLARDI